MGEVLYRKYRSKSLDEVVGQEHITETLKNALKTGQISHAYLFTGPKGVGKTSIARILAHEINSIPYTGDTHLDIIEIDAASNRHIDEIRDLRDKVHIAPTSAKYKVYIIDEVHMLTKEAFNALLKTLEEPPEHAVFILATTDYHKLPETIISRTQKYTFKPVAKNKVIDHLKNLAQMEGVDIDETSLELIAEHGQGSFRDSIGLLDTMKASGKSVKVDDVKSVLGIPSYETITNLLRNVDTGNLKGLHDDFQNLSSQGYQSKEIAKMIIESVHQQTLGGERPTLNYDQLNDLLRIGVSHDPGKALEIILIEAALKNRTQPVETLRQPVEKQADSKPSKQEAIQPEPEEAEQPKEVLNVDKEEDETPKLDPEDESLWRETLSKLKGKYNTLYGIARMAEPKINGKEIELVFSFPFHQRRCNEKNNKQKIQDTIHKLTGESFTITCTVSEKPKKPTQKKEPVKDESSLNNVRDIFGGGEVV